MNMRKKKLINDFKHLPRLKVESWKPQILTVVSNVQYCAEY